MHDIDTSHGSLCKTDNRRRQSLQPTTQVDRFRSAAENNFSRVRDVVFFFLTFNLLQKFRKYILRFGGLYVRLARRWSLRFPKRSVPLNCCSSLAASFFLSSLPSVTSLPFAIPVLALRPCLTNTAFASSLVRSASLHCVTSPVSIISGNGCSIFKVQCRAHIFIDFCPAMHYTETIFRHSL